MNIKDIIHTTITIMILTFIFMLFYNSLYSYKVYECRNCGTKEVMTGPGLVGQHRCSSCNHWNWKYIKRYDK